SYDKPNLLMGFDPSPYRYGFMRGVPSGGEEESVLPRIHEVAAELRAESFVAGVMVREVLPFLRQTQDKDDLYYYEYGFVEPRDVVSDKERYKIEEALTSGWDRYLNEGELMTGVECLWQNLS